MCTLFLPSAHLSATHNPPLLIFAVPSPPVSSCLQASSSTERFSCHLHLTSSAGRLSSSRRCCLTQSCRGPLGPAHHLGAHGSACSLPPPCSLCLSHSAAVLCRHGSLSGSPTTLSQGETKGRLRGLAAQKANILAAKAVCNILRTSLGPKGVPPNPSSQEGTLELVAAMRSLTTACPWSALCRYGQDAAEPRR